MRLKLFFGGHRPKYATAYNLISRQPHRCSHISSVFTVARPPSLVDPGNPGSRGHAPPPNVRWFLLFYKYRTNWPTPQVVISSLPIPFPLSPCRETTRWVQLGGQHEAVNSVMHQGADRSLDSNWTLTSSSENVSNDNISLVNTSKWSCYWSKDMGRI